MACVFARDTPWDHYVQGWNDHARGSRYIDSIDSCFKRILQHETNQVKDIEIGKLQSQLAEVVKACPRHRVIEWFKWIAAASPKPDASLNQALENVATGPVLDHVAHCH